MVFVALVAGLVVASFASIIVYVDATRRNRPPQKRLLWGGSVGALSFGGFLVPYLYADVFHRVYLLAIKPGPAVASPYEILVVHLAVGIAISAVSVLLYGFGSRY